MPEMKQPEALRLASYLDSFFISEDVKATKAKEIAAELRRLHAENAELTRLHDHACLTVDAAKEQVATLRAELVAEAARTAESTLRANQMTDQHRMQCNMREQGWQPIDSAPKDGRTMYVVRGFGITDKNVHCRNYTTDPYCVWPGDDGGWVRWPHAFPPTHWMPLPKPPAM